jgi:cell division protein FtsB
MSASTVLIILGSLVGILLVTAGTVGTWAAMRVGKNTQTVSNYREAAQSWQLKSQAQGAEIKELQAENTELRKQVADLSGQVGVLRDLITGASAVAEHDTRVNAYHSEVMARLAALEDLVRSTRAA